MSFDGIQVRASPGGSMQSSFEDIEAARGQGVVIVGHPCSFCNVDEIGGETDDKAQGSVAEQEHSGLSLQPDQINNEVIEDLIDRDPCGSEGSIEIVPANDGSDNDNEPSLVVEQSPVSDLSMSECLKELEGIDDAGVELPESLAVDNDNFGGAPNLLQDAANSDPIEPEQKRNAVSPYDENAHPEVPLEVEGSDAQKPQEEAVGLSTTTPVAEAYCNPEEEQADIKSKESEAPEAPEAESSESQKRSIVSPLYCCFGFLALVCCVAGMCLHQLGCGISDGLSSSFAPPPSDDDASPLGPDDLTLDDNDAPKEEAELELTSFNSKKKEFTYIPFWEVPLEYESGPPTADDFFHIPFWEIPLEHPPVAPRVRLLNGNNTIVLAGTASGGTSQEQDDDSHINEEDGSFDYDIWMEWLFRNAHELVLPLSAAVIGLLIEQAWQKSRVHKVIGHPTMPLTQHPGEVANEGSSSRINAVHSLPQPNNSNDTAEECRCCRCSDTLTKFENLLEFHKTFRPCGTGHMTHSLKEWQVQMLQQTTLVVGESYAKLTMNELKMLLAGLDPTLAGPKRVSSSSKAALVARVWESHAAVLATFTKPQIVQLLDAKGLIVVEKNANKQELIAAALEAGF